MTKKQKKPDPTTIRFQDEQLLADLDEVCARHDLSRRHVLETATANLLDLYEQEGPVVLLKRARSRRINQPEQKTVQAHPTRRQAAS